MPYTVRASDILSEESARSVVVLLVDLISLTKGLQSGQNTIQGLKVFITELECVLQLHA
jgi:hypothetical protein